MSNVSEDCISPEADRGTIALRAWAYTMLILLPLVLGSGVYLWKKNEKLIYLQRRGPFIVFLLFFGVIGSFLVSPLYRIFLNEEDNIVTSCFFVNFVSAIVLPLIILPNFLRMISFLFRATLNKELNIMHGKTKKGERAVGPVLFRDKVISEVNTSALDVETLNHINNLKFRSSTKFSLIIAAVLIVIILLFGFSYAFITCPTQISDRCDYVFASNSIAILLLFPLIPASILYIYVWYLTKDTSDPFKIKQEIKLFFGLLVLGIFFIVLSAFDVGGFAPTDSDDDIYFKWAQINDLITLIYFVHAVHIQVYYAIKFEKSSTKVFPMSLTEVLKNPDAAQLFKAFLEAEFSVENFLAYNILTNWRKNFDEEDDRVDKEARNIFRRWIDPKNKGVNISHKTRKKVQQNLESEEFTETLFDPIIAELFQLMERDSFLRFVNTDEYKVFVGAADPQPFQKEQYPPGNFFRCC